MTREPAVIATGIAGIINAVVLLATGEALDAEAQAAIVTVVTLIAGVIVRQLVTPVSP